MAKWTVINPHNTYMGNPSGQWWVVTEVQVQMKRQDRSYEISPEYTYNREDSAYKECHRLNELEKDLDQYWNR